MKIFLSSDMEGTAGVVDREQCAGDGPQAVAGRQLLLGEVNAAIEGAVAGGASVIVVNDSHSQMFNLPPQALARPCDLGRHKPLYMMQGLDGSFGAALFVSCHGSVGAAAACCAPATLRAVAEVRLNGTVTGEAGINALVAAHHQVPVVSWIKDRCLRGGCHRRLGIHTAAVKEPVSRLAAHSLHPGRACALIRAVAEKAVATAGQAAPPPLGPVATLNISVRTTDIAEAATWVRGVERAGPRELVITGDDLPSVYRSFCAAILLTRTIAEAV